MMTDIAASWRGAVAEEIRALEVQRYAAMEAGDVHSLAKLLDDELIYIHSTALRDDKAAYLKLIETGYLAYKAFHPITTQILLVSANHVIVSGQIAIDIIWNGAPKPLDNIYVLTWVRRPDKGWQFLTWQSTGVPALAA
jgi:ketosteroid isomerase-like protein